MKRLFAGMALSALSLDAAMAADVQVKAPRVATYFDWSGLYVGGHVGYGAGSFGSIGFTGLTLQNPWGPSSTPNFCASKRLPKSPVRNSCRILPAVANPAP